MQRIEMKFISFLFLLCTATACVLASVDYNMLNTLVTSCLIYYIIYNIYKICVTLLI